MSGTLVLNNNELVDEVVDLNSLQQGDDFPDEEELHESVDDEDYDDEDYDEEGVNDLNSMLGKYDFAIIFNSDTADINFIVPSPDQNDEYFQSVKDNFSQNSFMLNFVNYALNNKEWLEEYVRHFQDQNNKFMDTLLEFMQTNPDGEMNIDAFKKLFGQEQGDEVSGESSEDQEDSNLVDFAQAVQKLSANKPKIIT